MDSTNFTDFIKDSDDPNAEFHDWKSVTETTRLMLLAIPKRTIMCSV